MNHLFSTGEVAPAGRLSYWRERINEAFVPLDIAPLDGPRREQGFSGAVRMGDVGALRIARVSASPMKAIHRARHVEASADNDYFLALHIRGVAHATQDGRSATLHAGDFALLDSTRPYAIEFFGSGRFEHVIYRIPRAELDARCAGAEEATAVRVPLASNEGKVAAPYLNTLTTLATPIARGSAERLSATALDLLAAALAATPGASRDGGARSSRLPARVKQRTLSRIADPELSPASIAEVNFISVRQLHRVFAAEGTTFGTFLREERLRRCREDLADARLAGRPIAAIAERWGCRSPAHFTRIFTARYGVTPRAFRRSAQEERVAGSPAAG